MFFSVIIPNYNHGRFLEEMINSVLNQSYQNFELIILDDCSTDNSKEIILKYQFHAKVKSIVFNEKNNGSPFKQWKKGIELAKADWIWIAESDDLADPEFLRSAFEILKVSHASACYCDSYVIDENSKILYKVSDIKNKFFETEKWSLAYEEDGINELNEYLKFMCTINNASSLVFKKELFKKVENKITSFRYYGDWFYYLNVALQTNICYTGRILCS
jgi:glycosyltransferase involved in cell wall biosynthesis